VRASSQGLDECVSMFQHFPASLTLFEHTFSFRYVLEGR
jgi:hypothetical protein